MLVNQWSADTSAHTHKTTTTTTTTKNNNSNNNNTTNTTTTTTTTINNTHILKTHPRSGSPRGPRQFFYDTAAERDVSNDGCKLITAEKAKEGFDKIIADADGYGGFFLSDSATDEKFTNKTRSSLQLGSPLPGFKVE